MPTKQLKDIESLINLFSGAAGSISSQAIKSRAKGFLSKHHDYFKSALSSDPKVQNSLKYLQTSIHNSRLIKKLWLSHLRKIRKYLLTSSHEEQNFSFDPNKPFTSYRVLQSIFSTAAKEVLIYDAYVEEGTLDILSVLPANCRINMLTNNVYGNFAKEFKLFVKQYPNSAAKKIGSIHDRFFIIDNKAFIVGTSLHSVGGKKYTHIFNAGNTIESILRSHFSKLWASAINV